MRLIKNFDSERYRVFNETHPYGEILQSEGWGRFKALGEWEYELLGFEQEDQLVGATMMLKRKFPLTGKYIYYAPRGFLCDYQNKKIVKDITEVLTKYVKSNQGIVLKIDPCVIYQQRDSVGDLVEGGQDNRDLVDYLIKLGYRHHGATLDFNGIQPRFIYRLALDRSLDDLMAKFHHKTRYNIRYAQKKGVEIYQGNREDLKEFTRIMKITGQRDGFTTRPLKYFQDMYDTLEPLGKFKLYMARYNVTGAYQQLQQELDKEAAKAKPNQQRIEKLEKEQAEIKELVQQNPEGIIVSGTIMLINGKTAWYVYGASDNLYRNIMPNYLIQWEMIQDAYHSGCEIYDFRGISGDRSEDHHLYGLYRFKKGFTGEFVEYIGEFDYITNKPLYAVFNKGVPAAKKLLKKIKR